MIADAGAARDAPEERACALARATWPGARVEALLPLTGDASSRRYARLVLRGGGAPATAVAMLLPDDAFAPDEIAPDGSPARELPFLRVGRLLARHGIPVPAVHAAAVAEGVLLLEDVGDRTLAEAAMDGGAAPLLAEAVDVLARLAALARLPDVARELGGERYDREIIGRELAVVHGHGLAPSDAGPPRAPGSDPALERALARLGDAVAAQPVVLMHRDYHSWNLHVSPAGKLFVIDFQDALLGPALYDLASLLTDRDSDRFVTPEIEAPLVERFARGLAAAGGPDLGSGDELSRRYFEAVAYRTLRVIGRFRFLAVEKGKPGYLRFLPIMARQTRRALVAAGDDELLAALAARAAIFA